jgi:hypothetical protein
MSDVIVKRKDTNWDLLVSRGGISGSRPGSTTVAETSNLDLPTTILQLRWPETRAQATENPSNPAW